MLGLMRSPLRGLGILTTVALAVLMPGSPCSAQDKAEAPASQPPPSEPSRKTYFFYKGQDYGSESQFNPLTSFITWSYDTLQVPESFNDFDLAEHWQTVRWDLQHPNNAVQSQGGWNAFVNRQIFPYKGGRADWIPNYSLHLLGGGMVYRKNAEWFDAHGVPFPRLTAALVCTAAELFQEAVEKTSTKPDDEIADVYLFRPLGMLLFNWDRFARFAADDLHLVEWNGQPIYEPDYSRPDGTRGRITNVSQNFVIRPVIGRPDAPRAFVYFGLTTLVGLSHSLTRSDSFSWGFGASIQKAQDPTITHFSAGLFYDRNDSLLASVIFNGTDDLKVRLNIYPGIVGTGKWWSPGLYVGVGSQGRLSAGVTLRIFPVGFGRTQHPTPAIPAYQAGQ